jgi:hypothetical protein
MSKTDYQTFKVDFLKQVETMKALANYKAPLAERQKQLTDVGLAAVWSLLFRRLFWVYPSFGRFAGSSLSFTVIHPGRLERDRSRGILRRSRRI